MPLWLAIDLKRKKRCKIQPPAWLSVGTIDSQKVIDILFYLIHHAHFICISCLLTPQQKTCVPFLNSKRTRAPFPVCHSIILRSELYFFPSTMASVVFGEFAVFLFMFCSDRCLAFDLPHFRIHSATDDIHEHQSVRSVLNEIQILRMTKIRDGLIAINQETLHIKVR